MPPVFPSGACVQVRPFGATLPTAVRRAPFAREAADGYTCPQGPGRQHHRETRQSIPAESCHRDRPQRHLRGHVQNFDPLGRRDK